MLKLKLKTIRHWIAVLFGIGTSPYQNLTFNSNSQCLDSRQIVKALKPTENEDLNDVH